MLALDAGQPFTAAERDLAREVTWRPPQVLLVLNRIGQLSAEDRRAALALIEAASIELLGCTPEAVLAVSARDGEGMAALRRRLRYLACKERLGTRTRSLAGIAAAAAAEITIAARPEIRARELPLRELARRTEIFRAGIVERGELLTELQAAS